MTSGAGSPEQIATADVAVIPPIPGHESLSYAVPPVLEHRLREGMRVLVPLGRRRVTGIVVGRSRATPAVDLRPVLDVLDDDPLLSSDLLELCRFAATYYMSSLGEVLSTAVLAGLRAESRRTVRLAAHGPNTRLGSLEQEIVRHLPPERPVRVSTLARMVRSSGLHASLRSLAERGIVVLEEEPPVAAARARLERVYRLARHPTADELDTLARRAPAQRATLDRIREAGDRGVSSAVLPAADSAVRALAVRGLVTIERREVYRPVTEAAAALAPPSPTTAQKQAIDAVLAAASAARFETFLLRGVTGSGKTEVYLRAAEDVLARGGGVLMLVPEIGLTHALVAVVGARFGPSVALLHSALSPGERWDEWRRLARREARIAIGVRSAIFAPVPDLGLVIVDEEHDGAYKQEDGLRYNARDLAIVRARNASCPALLGSATPSIESHRATLTGRYRALELADRIERRPLPTVELVDLRIEPPEGTPRIFARRISDALADNWAAGGQSLVFLNRRGYANYLQCGVCGHVPGCPNCTVTLTFHLRSRLLRCHHCNYRLLAPDLCPECSGPTLRNFGVGTEQVEIALRAALPRARIARLDRDTTAKRGALRRLLDDWRERRIDVLVGTQMVTKGHDVPGVTLVAVVAADQVLNFPDFRAAERTFQMLAQVAGRAGRGDQPGRVLIQTYRPTHYALTAAAKHDFLELVDRELPQREALGYPPFSRLVNLRLDGVDSARVEELARALADALRSGVRLLPPSGAASVIGPAPAPLERLRGRYRWQILVKSKDPPTLRAVIRPALEAIERRARSRGVRVAVDVDPYGVL